MLSPSLSFLIVSPPPSSLLLPLSSLVPQREANGSFNTIDDSGVNAKFVNAVYDALLSTVSVLQREHTYRYKHPDNKTKETRKYAITPCGHLQRVYVPGLFCKAMPIKHTTGHF